MIRINQIKLSVTDSGKRLAGEIERLLHIKSGEYSYEIVRKSLDCRANRPLKAVYCVDVEVKDKSQERRILKKNNNKNIMSTKRLDYMNCIPSLGALSAGDQVSPIVVGTGPAGLFCGYLLALCGRKPILLERGKCIEERTGDVEAFWQERAPLNPESNVQFGEGGAGTFSDGKLNTVVKDRFARQRFILKTFVRFGAPEDILYLSRPHIGTDYLKTVVTNMRNEIIRLGGEVHFSSKVTRLLLQETANGTAVCGVQLADGTTRMAKQVVLAIGHSARDTFEALYEQGIAMEQKPFAVGVRMEHPRDMIDAWQYKEHYKEGTLPSAYYKLTHRASNGRNVFTFCMCPGGYVVNASSEQGHMVVNGMSNYDRMAVNSNSAVVVNVTPDDFESSHPLAGVAFQRKLERAMYRAGNGRIPVQLFGDFEKNVPSTALGEVALCERGGVTLTNVRECLPEWVSFGIMEAVRAWDAKIHGYARQDALVLGVESRTSSPVKIVRNEQLMSAVFGLYPCGEGAGYAGGIMSAAIDGLKVAEQMLGIDLESKTAKERLTL